MSVFSGPMGKGAMREHRAQKRKDAEQRNARTPDNRRRQNRLQGSEQTVARKKRRKRK